MIGLILLPLLVIGCFSLMKKGFSEEGIPFSEKTRLTGNAGKFWGVICGILGLVFLVLWIFMVKGSMM
jgi:hypothetical protein